MCLIGVVLLHTDDMVFVCLSLMLMPSVAPSGRCKQRLPQENKAEMGEDEFSFDIRSGGKLFEGFQRLKCSCHREVRGREAFDK